MKYSPPKCILKGRRQTMEERQPPQSSGWRGQFVRQRSWKPGAGKGAGGGGKGGGYGKGSHGKGKAAGGGKGPPFRPGRSRGGQSSSSSTSSSSSAAATAAAAAEARRSKDESEWALLLAWLRELRLEHHADSLRKEGFDSADRLGGWVGGWVGG